MNEAAAPQAEATQATAGPSSSEWSIEVTEGPNKGAIVPLGHDGTFRIGTGLSNDIVLADSQIASEQAVLNVSDDGASIESLADGMMVDGKSMPSGQSLAMQDGMEVTTGDTKVQVHGPAARKRRVLWLVAAVPVLLLGIGVAALGGLASPAATKPVVRAVDTAPEPPPSGAAAKELSRRLEQAGIGSKIRVTASTGAVVAEGYLSGSDMALWSEQQIWFDGNYKGSLSLVNRVREAVAEETPNVKLSAVSAGANPYLITSNGDRFTIGANLNGWIIDEITPEKVVLTKNGRHVELAL